MNKHLEHHSELEAPCWPDPVPCEVKPTCPAQTQADPSLLAELKRIKAKHHITCSYLEVVTTTDGLRNCVDMLVRKIRKSKIQFSAIAFRGMSGSLVGPTVALRLKKEFLMVRKEEARTHSEHKVEGTISVTDQTYIIVDDFISSGNTVRETINQIKDVLPNAKCLAVFTYKPKSNSYSELNMSGYPEPIPVK
jgi:orotate phosphoribosyltransferase-like protein